MLRSRHEAQGSQAAPVLRLTGGATLVENARVYTAVDARGTEAAIAIDRGRVVAIGSRRAVRTAVSGRVERIDCGGGTLLPGLIDPHLHLFALAARRAHLDLGSCATVGALLDAVALAARRVAPGSWVRGEGLDEICLGRLPTSDELESAAPGRPVRLRHRSRHASVLNRHALLRLGETLGVERRDGHPTGLVAGREEQISRVVGLLSAGEISAGLASEGRALAAEGLTCVGDATPRGLSSLAPLEHAMAAGQFRLRVFAMRGPRSAPWARRGLLACGPVKIMVHEEPGGLRPRPRELARRIAQVAAMGGRVAVHCVGAATLVTALAAFAALPEGLRRRGHRLEHVGECPPALVPEIARLGLTVVTNPAFVRLRGDAYRAAPDGPPASWLYRANTLRRAGIPLAGASDAPVAPARPWLGIAAARTRRTERGALLGAVERLSARGALELFTAGAAHALRAPRLGHLSVGGPADLVVVDPDPFTAAPDEVAATRVRLTMVAGAVVWRA